MTKKEIEDLALKQGSILMTQDGVLRALAGETTLDKVFRVAA